MNQYQKTGIFIFRLVAVLQIFSSFIVAFYISVTAIYSKDVTDKIMGMIVTTIILGVIFSVPGLLMFLLGRKLGTLVGKNLEG